MCGIAGILAPRAQGCALIWESGLHAMADALGYCGPYADGIWLDAETGIGPAPRRLSTLGRDRTGEKPAYLRRRGGRRVVGAEFKALRFITGFRPRLDSEAIAAFLDFGQIEGTCQRGHRHPTTLEDLKVLETIQSSKAVEA